MTRAASLLVASALLAGCPRPVADVGDDAVGDGRRYVFLGDRHVATVEEQVRGRTVTRRSSLASQPQERSVVEVSLDERGFLRRARYERRGARGERHVQVEVGTDRAVFRGDGDPRGTPLPAPVVLLDTLRFVAASALPADATLLDLTTGEHARVRLLSERGVLALDEHGLELARVTADGSLVGPGVFSERPTRAAASAAAPTHPSAPAPPDGAYRMDLGDPTLARIVRARAPGQRRLDDGALEIDKRHVLTAPPPTAADRSPSSFLRSDDDAVVVFAREHARGESALADALALAEAIHESVDITGGGGPPSARNTLRRRAGDCDDVTALLVASLRALGHAARPVSGYRHIGGRWAPHAWAEVWDGRGAWVPVDALVPGVGPFATHVSLFEGLGSPLTMGRALGRFRPTVNGLQED